VIGNPYYGLNDFNLRWIANSNWTYTAQLPVAAVNGSSTWLQFDGLDTFCSINLCGQHVASTNNQFRQWYFDVSDILNACTGSPQLNLNFGSAPNIANAIANEPGQETWPYGVEIPFEFPNRQFIRKEQNDFGWDWGPAFAPAGPWQPAYMISLGPSDIHARNLLVDIYRQGQLNNLSPDESQPWILNASVDFLGTLPSEATIRYILSDKEYNLVKSGRLSNTTASVDSITGSIVLPCELDLKLWWPSGLGDQNLYNLRIDVVDASNRTLSSSNRRVGFRTVVLDTSRISQEQLDLGVAPGNNWRVLVNGHEFYAKGSNFIPPDPFWNTVTEPRLRRLFQSAIDGRQNMLRVWSSGAYSPDFMYDLADGMDDVDNTTATRLTKSRNGTHALVRVRVWRRALSCES